MVEPPDTTPRRGAPTPRLSPEARRQLLDRLWRDYLLVPRPEVMDWQTEEASPERDEREQGE